MSAKGVLTTKTNKIMLKTIYTSKWNVTGELGTTNYNHKTGKYETYFYPTDYTDMSGKVPLTLAKFITSNDAYHDFILIGDSELHKDKFVIIDSLTNQRRYFKIETISEYRYEL